MNDQMIILLGACSILYPAGAVEADSGGPLVLAENGQTRYAIVIGAEADYGEDMAARELALFLHQITGAEFPIRHDDAPASDFEIVLGRTRRKSMSRVPAHLRNDNWEGFAIVREGDRLYIMGNIPRGTLYGVYDFLDVELGVRFLADGVNHVPEAPTLKVDMASRQYAPPIERRTIWEGLGGDMMLRNRMNGAGFVVLNHKLGGVKIIGAATHTFNTLVPVEQYFDEFPEYFSEIDGERRREYKGNITQLCMTNPDVRRIATASIRKALGPAVEASPYDKHIVSVTVNDSPWFCKCARCVAVNAEERVEEGGTLIRFVNAIATELDDEYPNVAVETMVYGTSLPRTRPVANVLMQMVRSPDWRYALDDPSCAENRELLAEFRRTKQAVGDGALYNWLWIGTYGSSSFLDPRPNLRYLAHNIRVMNECGVTGLFCQTVQSHGTEMQDLRYYLLARAMWRPTLDGRGIIEEFCRLYYREAAEDVLRYIDFLHDGYARKDRSAQTMADTTVIFDDAFVTRGDAILAEAESKAPAAEVKQRAATCRLPIWKLKLDRAFGQWGRVFTFPVNWSFRIDPEDRGLSDEWPRSPSFDGWSTMRIDAHWTEQGEEHRGAAWYGIDFDMPSVNDAPLALWFGAIDGDADVFLDGQKVGEQKLPATSMWQHDFFVPLDDGLSPGKHRLIVRVFKPNFAAGIWKPVAIIDMSVPIPPDLRTAGERFITVGRAADLAFISESYGGRYTQTEKMYYSKIEFFLQHGATREGR